MQFFPAALQNLADQFARLPGIGGKTAQRLAFHVLSLPLEDAENFAEAILEVVTIKASALLGRPVKVVVVDMSAKPANNPQMEKLLNFGRAHSDVIKIKE